MYAVQRAKDMSSESQTRLIDCESRDCCNVATYPLGGRMPYMRCGQCRVAFYCSKECQVAHWRHHKPICNQYNADKALRGNWKRFDSSAALMVDLKRFKRFMSDAMKQRRFTDRRGALSLEFRTMEDMDKAIAMLAQSHGFGELSMAFVKLDTFQASYMSDFPRLEMLAYPLDSRFIVCIQMPMGDGSREKLSKFVSLSYVNDE